MKRALQTIQEGREARRAGVPFHDNPYDTPNYVHLETDKGVEIHCDDVDHNSLWAAGWNIEDKYPQKEI